jgi:hypothetical protein
MIDLTRGHGEVKAPPTLGYFLAERLIFSVAGRISR